MIVAFARDASATNRSSSNVSRKREGPVATHSRMGEPSVPRVPGADGVPNGNPRPQSTCFFGCILGHDTFLAFRTDVGAENFGDFTTFHMEAAATQRKLGSI